jgi:hypothetical protein
LDSRLVYGFDFRLDRKIVESIKLTEIRLNWPGMPLKEVPNLPKTPKTRVRPPWDQEGAQIDLFQEPPEIEILGIKRIRFGTSLRGRELGTTKLCL